MTDLQEILENALNDANVEGSDNDNTVDKFAHWQRICVTGIAAVSAGCTKWLQLAAAAVVLHSNDVGMSSIEKEVMRRSMLTELFNSDRSCYVLIRMSPNTFKALCEKLDRTGRLRSYAHMSGDEQVATLLSIVGQKISNRVIAFFMSRSGETISRYFHNVLQALLSLASEVVKQPTKNDISNVIMHCSRFYPYFKDCLGVVDGNHVRVKVPKLNQVCYRWRKDIPAQNVLACFIFNLRFSYVLASWEGSTSNSRILKSALTREDSLRIPNGKYYLGDVGFGLSSQILVPYGKTRYHLKEYALRGPQNYQELFTHRHSSLRNCIERCFGVLKKRFPIISTRAECQYSCDTMMNIILACCILHNFLQSLQADTAYAVDEEEHLERADEGLIQDIGESYQDKGGDYTKGNELRDIIALKMWSQYEIEGNRLQIDSSI